MTNEPNILFTKDATGYISPFQNGTQVRQGPETGTVLFHEDGRLTVTWDGDVSNERVDPQDVEWQA